MATAFRRRGGRFVASFDAEEIALVRHVLELTRAFVAPERPDTGDPFLTTYYLTCPHLVAAIARIEAAGGVERWSEEVERVPELAADLERATVEQRRIRRELAGDEVGRDGGSSLELGIGGSGNPRRLKCLHAHAAYALARPGYLIGERILAELDPRWPPRCCLGSPS